MCLKCTESPISSEGSCKVEGQKESDLAFKVKDWQNIKEGTNRYQVTFQVKKNRHYKTIQTKKLEPKITKESKKKDIFMNVQVAMN